MQDEENSQKNFFHTGNTDQHLFPSMEITWDILDRDFPLSLLDSFFSFFLRYLVANSCPEELEKGDLLLHLDGSTFSFPLRNFPNFSKIPIFWLANLATL